MHLPSSPQHQSPSSQNVTVDPTQLKVVVQPESRPPPLYRGDQSELFSIHEWEDMMKSYMNRVACSSDSERSELIMSRLAGRARDVVKVSLRSCPRVSPAELPTTIVDILKRNFSEITFSSMPIKDFYATMPCDSESVMDYWIRLNKAIDVADECLHRRGKGVEDPSAEVVMMFICHCPDPSLAVYFQFKPVELWTAAEVQERLDGHVRSLRSTAACAQHAVNISTCTHESTVPAPHCGMQHQLPVVVTPPLVPPTPATACAPVPCLSHLPLCLLLMRTSSRLPLCLTRFCLFALHHWLMQAKHLTSPRPTPASPGTLLAAQEAIPEGLNIPASSPALRAQCVFLQLLSCISRWLGPELPDVVGTVQLKQAVILLPQREYVVWGKLPSRSPISPGSTVMVEPTSAHSTPRNILVGRVVTPMWGDRWIPVKVLNPTQRAITLRRNAKIADVFPCLAVEDLPITQGLCRSQCGLSDPPTVSPRSAGDPVQLLKDCGLADINVDGCEVSESCKRKLAELVLSYQDVFSRDKLDCGEAKEFVHRIRLSDDRPFRLPYRRVPPGHYQQLREVLSDMEMKGIISKSLSEYASPLVMVWKKNGDLRICTDFRWLNTKTIKDAHPLPHQADCLSALGGNALLSTMDLTSGFYNVPLHESDRKFTAFTTPMGLYEYNRLPQGLCNSPASFMLMMLSIFGGLNFSSLLCYLDDLLVFAPLEEEALRRLEVVFSRLRANNLKLSQKKCNFLRKSVRFLGHIVDASGVSVDQEKVAVISGFRKEDLMDADGCTPSQQKVRSFLCMVLYYQHFIPGCSTIAKPLFALTGGQKRKLKGSRGNRRVGTFRTLTLQDWDPAYKGDEKGKYFVGEGRDEAHQEATICCHNDQDNEDEPDLSYQIKPLDLAKLEGDR
ncbi:hypothetical protein AAFF_G00333510 [Aldrovandia affinis]|uniref:ribonuclease H n=1 Tax=Aldrovandia affinis TaxID=143900 RepID=A0AAD7VZV9_9TELE|nr:hypothetical protein AAFF_G00333510 [Aldrovandia affinis]